MQAFLPRCLSSWLLQVHYSPSFCGFFGVVTANVLSAADHWTNILATVSNGCILRSLHSVHYALRFLQGIDNVDWATGKSRGMYKLNV